MRVLYIALSCSPYGGSEDAVGWNTPLAMIQSGADVTVITRSEQKPYIERWHKENPGELMPHFEYVPMPWLLDAKLFRGQFQSLRLNPWLRRVHRRIVHMLRSEDFDVIHQITPVEFRAVMKPVKHAGINVVGPLGGAGEPCSTLKPYLGDGKAERIRLFVNQWVINSKRNANKLSMYDIRYFANYETRNALVGHGVKRDDPIVTDVGCATDIKSVLMDETRRRRRLHVLFMGRLVPRKGVLALLEALTEIGLDACDVRIYGDGPEQKCLESFASEHGLSNVHFMGRIDHEDIDEAYRWADILAFPSVRETTGVVLAEALSHGMPVVAFNQYGAKVVLDSACSQLVEPSSGAHGLAEAIEMWIEKPERIPSYRDVLACSTRLTWGHKTKQFLKDYHQALDISMRDK